MKEQVIGEKEIGVRVRARRRELKMTQSELSERANLSLTAIKNLESGGGSSLKSYLRVLYALEDNSLLSSMTEIQEKFSPRDIALAGMKKRGRK